MRQPRFDADDPFQFVVTWQLSPSVGMVASLLERPRKWVLREARYFRMLGVRLKSMQADTRSARIRRRYSEGQADELFGPN
jgi:hypothetical protein